MAKKNKEKEQQQVIIYQNYDNSFGSITSSTPTTQVTFSREEGTEQPKMIFKQIKEKMGFLEGMKYRKQIKNLENYHNELIKNGQIKFGDCVLKETIKKIREVDIYSKGIKYFVEKSMVNELINKVVRGKQISLTLLKDYARPIPNDVLKKQKEFIGYFDNFYILHADSSDMIDKKELENVEETIKREKDPILFGTINESGRLYFIADWEDEFCDLTFEDLIDKLDIQDENEITLKNNIINK